MERTALVLSAGGVRGAYQVGVLAGLVEILGRDPAGPPLFDIFTGSSIGAINAAWMVANADRGDHAIAGLEELWTGLDFDEILKFRLRGSWGWPLVRSRRRPDPGLASPHVGRALLDPRPVERLLSRVIAWDRLHANIRTRLVRGLMIAALDICDGTTTLFTELAEGVSLRPYPYLTERSVFTPIDAQHVLAATALPFMFPSRRIDDRYYMDGAMRFETPVVPALRVGAERVVAISLLDQAEQRQTRRPLLYPGVMFLIGQLLNAVLLDPLLHDIDNLRRNNRIIDVLAETLDEPTTLGVIASLESEVPPGRPAPTLVFRPSESLEALTSEFLHEEFRRRPLRRSLLRRFAHDESGQALLASFLYFDGRLAARLIDLGRRDAYAHEDRVLAFFGV
jgi:NTE family protein